MKKFRQIFAAATLLIAFSHPAFAGEKQLTVVELFTSQGCSSCPPADKFLGELAKRDDIVALSVHVDYWDYIGWKDPFASAANTKRQRQYSRRFNLRYVYTPQIVVQGALQVPGSYRDEVMEKIESSKSLERVEVRLERDGDNLKVTLPETKVVGDVQILMAPFDKQHTTDIQEGENSGRTLSYYNVLRKLERVGIWRGEEKSVSMPWHKDWGDGVAVILQAPGTGRILGAAKLTSVDS